MQGGLVAGATGISHLHDIELSFSSQDKKRDSEVKNCTPGHAAGKGWRSVGVWNTAL
jgi:hypothetical protein